MLLQALPVSGGSGGGGDASAACEATGWLRRQLSAARASAAPRFTPEAVDLLQRYVVSVRQVGGHTDTCAHALHAHANTHAHRHRLAH